MLNEKTGFKRGPDANPSVVEQRTIRHRAAITVDAGAGFYKGGEFLRVVRKVSGITRIGVQLQIVSIVKIDKSGFSNECFIGSFDVFTEQAPH